MPRAINKRIGVYPDELMENSFIVENSDLTFARINKIGNLWCVWFYTKHLQRTYSKLRDSLIDINKEFVDYVGRA